MRELINLILEASRSNMSPQQARSVFAEYGVPDAATLSADALRNARMWLIKRHHPDLGGQADAGAMINSAYDTLKLSVGSRAWAEEPPKSEPPKSEPRFRVGQWVVHLDDDIIGKIKNRLRSKSSGELFYDIKWADGSTDRHKEGQLRAATQEDIDRATSRGRSRKAEPMQTQKTNLKIIALAHYENPAQNSNKIYGIVDRNGKTFTFWGGGQQGHKD
jgi:hypothetical protein